MSPSVLRVRTLDRLRRARITYGDSHRATWAAYGRAIAAWGNADRLRSVAPQTPQLDLDLVNIATLAGYRASRRAGHDNRHVRAHRAA